MLLTATESQSFTTATICHICTKPLEDDKLAKTLEDDEFRYLSESCIGLIRHKGVYPYDYMDSFDRFEETELPSQDAFFHDIYLQLDVFLLADYF